MRDDAGAIQRKRRAVEDQLVLAADHVGIDQRNSIFRDAFAHHVVTGVLLAQVVRRRIQYQQNLRAGGTARRAAQT